MKRLFIIGNGPLPEDQEGITNAASLRTNQFIQSLIKKNKEFDLILITIHDQPETKYQIEFQTLNLYGSDTVYKQNNFFPKTSTFHHFFRFP